MENTNIETETLDEVLNLQQRRKRGQIMKKYKNKLRLARLRTSRRIASRSQLIKRSKRAAIMAVRRRFAGKMGANYHNLSAAQKSEIDKKVHTKKPLVKKLAVRLFQRIRKAEVQRFQNRGKANSSH